MPTYTYACTACNHSFDVFHSMTATPEVLCEHCGSKQCEKQIGTGAGIIFKGSGFYETDYKEKKGKKPSASKKSEAKKSEGASTKSEAPAAKGKKPAAASKG